jgi:hypothetical protein
MSSSDEDVPAAAQAAAEESDASMEAAMSGEGAKKEWMQPADRMEMAMAVSATFFGISGIEGRSEFGARQADFQDAERSFSLAYAVRPYRNLGFGITGKYLGQTLESASATGSAFDTGLWYGLPAFRHGRYAVALALRDVGGSLEWTVPDPVLDTEFTYKEKVASKAVAGVSYSSPQERWIAAMDLLKASGQDVRVHAGLEWRATRFFQLRGGLNAYNPTGGFGLGWRGGALDLQFDYAYQYDLESFVNPHWVTFTLRFLPFRT